MQCLTRLEPPMVTHSFKAEAVTRKTTEPPMHTHHKTENSTKQHQQQTRRKKQKTATPRNKPRWTRQDEAQAERKTTSRQESQLPNPNSRKKRPRVLRQSTNNKRNKANKTTRAINTLNLSKHKTHTHTRNNTKQHGKTPAGERFKSQPTTGGKEIPTAPLLSHSHPPDPRRSREGRAINKRG